MAIHSNTLSQKCTTLTACSLPPSQIQTHTHTHTHTHPHTHNNQVVWNSLTQEHRKAVIKWSKTGTHNYYITLTAPTIAISLSYMLMQAHTHFAERYSDSQNKYFSQHLMTYRRRNIHAKLREKSRKQKWDYLGFSFTSHSLMCKIKIVFVCFCFWWVPMNFKATNFNTKTNF